MSLLDLAESATPTQLMTLLGQSSSGRMALHARDPNEFYAEVVLLTPKPGKSPCTPATRGSLARLRGSRMPSTPSEEASLLRTVSRVLKEHLESVEKAKRNGYGLRLFFPRRADSLG
jgi:hypothetical protein